MASAKGPRASLRLSRVLARLVYLARHPHTGLATLRAGWWAVSVLRKLRGEIAERGLEAQVEEPPRVSPDGLLGVEAALRYRHATCLERSLIVQRWLVSHGISHEVLIGVSGGASGVEAHAWLEHYDAAQDDDFRVLTRVPARTRADT